MVQQGRAFAREIERLQATEISVTTLGEADYPEALRWIPEPPPVLYIWGTLRHEDSLAVAVVGSRKPSPYGQLAAQRLSTELAQYGFTVVSGLARGVDSLAHQGALQAGGRTIAVLGSGINVVYPPEHRRLYEAIRDQGAVVSEFPFDTKPDRWNFPRRNRIISGLTLGTLVVEASDQSGSLHTARHALEQGREVFAVPGRIDVPSSRGTNNLIKRGAKLVEGIDDILEEFPAAVRLRYPPAWHGTRAYRRSRRCRRISRLTRHGSWRWYRPRRPISRQLFMPASCQPRQWPVYYSHWSCVVWSASSLANSLCVVE